MISTGRLDGRAVDPDRGGQPPPGRHRPGWTVRATSPTCGTAGSPRPANNIDLGWVLGQRLTRVPLDGSEPFADALARPPGQGRRRRPRRGDQPRRATSSPSPAAERMKSCSSAPTCSALPWRSRRLARPDRRRPARTTTSGSAASTLGGRPTELAFAPDGKTLYVANYLADAVQVVDAEIGVAGRRRSRSAGPSELSLDRRGEILFHDADRSFNQWYSCNTCHSDGHTNGRDFDTLNDGWQDLSTAHTRSRKKVPTLRRRRADRPLDLARLADEPRRRHGRVVHQEHAGAAASARARSRRSWRSSKTLDYPPQPLPRAGRLALSEPRSAARPSSSPRRPPATPATAAPSSPTARSTTVGLEERGDVLRGLQPAVAPRRLRQGPLPPRRPRRRPSARPSPATTAPKSSPASAR